MITDHEKIYQSEPGADYGLGTIGTCLGPPLTRGPPSDQKKNPMISVEKNDKNEGIVGYILFVNYYQKWTVKGAPEYLIFVRSQSIGWSASVIK